MESDHLLDRDRLGLMSGALLLGLSFTRLADAPGRYLATEALGSPVGINISGATLLLLITAALSVTSMEALLQGHPLVYQHQVRRTLIFWIMPTLLAVGASGFLLRIEAFGAWALGLLLFACLIPLALTVEYYNVDPNQQQKPSIIWGENLYLHLTALLLYALIFGLGVRTLLSGPAVLVATFLVSFRLLYFTAPSLRQAAYYALAVGTVAGLLTWAINISTLGDNQGALLLLLFFYLSNGLLQNYIRGNLARRVVIEYALVTVVGVIIVMLI